MAIRKIPPTAARLREVLHYNPETGEFIWIKPRPGHKPCIAGSISAVGKYRHRLVRYIGFDRKQYFAHHLAWLYMTGEWPIGQIDHHNTDSLDNRWVNLRAATAAQNRRNHGVSRRNTSGKVGAFYHKTRKVWWSQIKGRQLGIFQTRDEAHEAYRQAAIELYGEFAHHSLK